MRPGQPGIELLRLAMELGIQEVSAYGFTKENVRRTREQVAAFQDACGDFAMAAVAEGAALLVVGDSASPVFSEALLPFAEYGAPGRLPFNLLVNYGWRWDLRQAVRSAAAGSGPTNIADALGSAQVSRIDLAVRWADVTGSQAFCRCSARTQISMRSTFSGRHARSRCGTCSSGNAVQDVTLGA